jgi:hypothetical protein
MPTPCTSAASNSTTTLVSDAKTFGWALFGTALPRLSCLIRSGLIPRLASMNGGGPLRRNSGDDMSLTVCSMNSLPTCPAGTRPFRVKLRQYNMVLKILQPGSQLLHSSDCGSPLLRCFSSHIDPIEAMATPAVLVND